MLVLLDIDGTLLNSMNCIDEMTKNVIAAHRNNNRFVLCSARKPSSTKQILYRLNLGEEVIVCYNGALIIEENEKLSEKTLSKDNVAMIYRMAKECDVTINIYCDDIWMVEKLDRFVLEESKIIGEQPYLVQQIDEGQNVHKILLLGYEDKLKCLKERLAKVNGLVMCNSKKGYLEITSSQASKRKALEFLLKYFSVDVQDSMAIGDGYNDLELLQNVGIGVAMDNSPDDVKEVAQFVTYSNDKKGVGFALDKFLK